MSDAEPVKPATAPAAAPKLPSLICTVGLPRAGKSTWALGTGHPIVCPDAIRLATHGRRFHAPAEPFVWATAKLMVRALFLAGHPVVILDATNGTMKRRREWLDSAWITRFKLFLTPPEVCMDRLKASGDKEYIDEMAPVISRMYSQFEPLAPWELESDAG